MYQPNSDLEEINNTDRIILQENFYVNERNKSAFNVKLTDQGVILTKEYKDGKQKVHSIPLQQIIGVCCWKTKPFMTSITCLCGNSFNGKPSEDSKSKLKGNANDAYLYIHAYIIKTSRSHNRTRKERNTIALRFRSFDKYDQNAEEANKWKNCLLSLMNVGDDNLFRMHLYMKGYLILLNPKSGNGKAREIFNKIIAPVLNDANIQYDLHITKGPNYARNFVRTKILYQWSAVIVVGGDGLFYEVINGVFERHDWENVVNCVRFGIIPAGSGNGLAKTISHCSGEQLDETPALTSAISMVNGSVTPMDLVRIETNDRIMYSSLACGWGFISDVDILSEKIRAVGYTRFTIWSLKNIVTLPKYNGRVCYLPLNYKEYNEVNVFTSTKRKISNSNETGFDSEFDASDSLNLEHSIEQNNPRGRLDSWFSANSKKTTYLSVSDSRYESINNESNINNVCMYGPPSSLPSLISPISHDWKVIEDDFVMVHAVYQTHLSSDCFFSPASKLQDGIIWLLIMRGGISRSELTSFLINMSNGTHLPKIQNNNVQMIPCRAFRIEPHDTKGIITVDGEKINYGPLQGEIIPSLINVIVPNKNIPEEKAIFT
uniref:CSON011479 protein n=1 Tax=Culicoides sonorensis TaxID=179676 RepID=A0A336LKV8_CULSO